MAIAVPQDNLSPSEVHVEKRRKITTASQALVAAILIACSHMVQVTSLSAGVPHYGTCHWLYNQLVSDRKNPAETMTSWDSWATWDVPEYQDLQRLPETSRGRYGPITCVVARPRLDTLTAAQFAADTGVTVALLVVRHETTHPLNRTHTHLGITPATSLYCVIARRPAGGPGTTAVLADATVSASGLSVAEAGSWLGYVIPADGGHCTRTTEKPIAGIRIGVPPGLSADKIPAVARFIADPSWLSGIGFRCLDGWCAVGISRMQTPAHQFSNPGISPDDGRVLIPGWYDDQQIAMPGSDAGLHIAAAIHASVVPFPAIDDYDVDAFDDWRDVAIVRFADAPADKYLAKWHFKTGAATSNTIQLRRVKSVLGLFGTKWKVRVNGIDVPELKVTRTEHLETDGFKIVGTARWAWSDNDEPIWVRCGNGCCMIEPIDEGTS